MEENKKPQDKSIREILDNFLKELRDKVAQKDPTQVRWVDHEWSSYSGALPRNVSQVQYDETKRAFYAGAAAIYRVLVYESAKLKEEDAIKMYRNIQDEFKDFIEELKESIF